MLQKFLTWTLCIVLVLLAVFELFRPDILLIGNVTVDKLYTISKSYDSPGGAVTYAAAVAKGYGRRVCLVSAASENTDLSFLETAHTELIPSTETLTFEHTYTWFGNQRRLRVVAKPNVTITASHVPWHCRLARMVLIGPLVDDDIDVPSFTKPKSWVMRIVRYVQIVGLMAQGHQRKLGPKGKVQHLRAPSETLLSSLTPEAHLFLSDVETDTWTNEQHDDVVSRVKSLVVTRGAQGVSVYQYKQDAMHIPAVKISPLDTNGAGDSFATTFMISLSQAKDIEHAGMDATWAASRVCLQPQTCKPQCCTSAVQARDSSDSQPHASRKKPASFRLEQVDETRQPES